jgi:hypothetical protein
MYFILCPLIAILHSTSYPLSNGMTAAVCMMCMCIIVVLVPLNRVGSIPLQVVTGATTVGGNPGSPMNSIFHLPLSFYSIDHMTG